MKHTALTFVTIAAAALAAPALAGFVSYSTGGWSQQFPGPLTAPQNAPWGPDGYPGDTVGFAAHAGSLDLTPGAYDLKINTLQWTINFTYGGASEPWPDMPLAFNAVRSLTIDGVGGSVNQDGNLLVNYYNDYLSLSDGPAATFYVQGFRVDVTPLGLASVGGSNFDGDPGWVQPTRDVMARFVVTQLPAVPAPGAALLAAIGAGLVARIKRHFA